MHTSLSMAGSKSLMTPTIPILCTPYDIFHIQLKAKYLSVTLTQALSLYPTSIFLNICTSAIDRIDEVDYDGCDTESTGRMRNPKTIMRWYRTFCDNNHLFPNPAISRLGRKSTLPLLFHNHPDLYLPFMTYAKTNLQTLSAETLHDYLFTTALPEIVSKLNKMDTIE
jgi:hypothetical protein